MSLKCLTMSLKCDPMAETILLRTPNPCLCTHIQMLPIDKQEHGLGGIVDDQPILVFARQ